MESKPIRNLRGSSLISTRLIPSTIPRDSTIPWDSREKGGLSSRASFTLIELLVVVAIIAILSVFVIITINPAELLKQGRDSQRVSDIATINSALNLYQVDNTSGSLGVASTTYISIPDPTATSTAGTQCQGLGLPSLPSGWTYHCPASSTYRNTDGTGWIPVNFSSISYGSPLGSLPVDPTNTSSSGYYYTYTPGGSWQLTATPESQKTRTNTNQTNSLTGAITQGSDLTLSPLFNSSGLVGYWKFDEGTGSAANDSSGNNNGTWNGTGNHWATGKVGGAGQSNGTNDQIDVPYTSALDFGLTDFSVSLWVNASKAGGDDYPLVSGQPGWGTAPNAIQGYAVRIITASNWNFTMADNNGAFAVSFGTRSLNTWVHLVATAHRNGDNSLTLNTYVNGQFAGTSTTGVKNTTAAGASYHLKLASNLSLAYQGFIDDVRIYNRALSAAEIAALYNATK